MNDLNVNEAEHRAVKELLREDSPEGFTETLDLFFESWLTSEATDGSTGKERAVRYMHYKASKRFFSHVND